MKLKGHLFSFYCGFFLAICLYFTYYHFFSSSYHIKISINEFQSSFLSNKINEFNIRRNLFLNVSSKNRNTDISINVIRDEVLFTFEKSASHYEDDEIVLIANEHTSEKLKGNKTSSSWPEMAVFETKRFFL